MALNVREKHWAMCSSIQNQILHFTHYSLVKNWDFPLIMNLSYTIDFSHYPQPLSYGWYDYTHTSSLKLSFIWVVDCLGTRHLNQATPNSFWKMVWLFNKSPNLKSLKSFLLYLLGYKIKQLKKMIPTFSSLLI